MTALDLWRWTQLPRLLPRCTIGKFRGKPWAEVEGGFLEWMTRQGDMDEDLKWNASNELARRRLV
jgi:exodeoxyribonuclease X